MCNNNNFNVFPNDERSALSMYNIYIEYIYVQLLSAQLP